MKLLKRTVTFLIALALALPQYAQDANKIIAQMDKNISADNSVSHSTIVVHGKRNTRKMVIENYNVGTEKAFTEYLQPAREKGTKMLKLNKDMWIYSPQTDRTIMISGHMLRQSVMGTDLSYEDLMEDRKLYEIYNAELEGKEEIDGRECYKIKLTAKVDDIAYYSSRIWIDVEHIIPLQQEYFAKSGELLKRIHMTGYRRIGRMWAPKVMTYKDLMKDGNGTEMILDQVKFDQNIPASYFTKAALKK